MPFNLQSSWVPPEPNKNPALLQFNSDKGTGEGSF